MPNQFSADIAVEPADMDGYDDNFVDLNEGMCA